MSLLFKDREFFINHTSGTVMEQQQKTITSVSSDRGYVNPALGIYSMPRINSSTTDVSTIFAQSDDGSEWTARLSDLNVPVRDGHTISLVTLEEKGNPEVALPVAVVNHSINQVQHLFEERRLANALNHVNAGERLILSMFGGWALTIPAMFAELWWVAGGLFFFGPVIVSYLIDGDRKELGRSYASELSTYVDRLIKSGPLQAPSPATQAQEA